MRSHTLAEYYICPIGIQMMPQIPITNWGAPKNAFEERLISPDNDLIVRQQKRCTQHLCHGSITEYIPARICIVFVVAPTTNMIWSIFDGHYRTWR